MLYYSTATLATISRPIFKGYDCMTIVALPSTFSPAKFVARGNIRRLMPLMLIGLLTAGINPKLSAEPAAASSGMLPQSEYPKLAQLDWHIDDQHAGCGGFYVNPLQIKQQSHSEALQASADASAIEADKLLFSGNVLIQHGDISLQAEEASYDAEQQQLVLTDNVIIRTPAAAFGSASALFDIDQQSTHMQEANYVLHQRHLRGEAESIRRSADHRLTVEQGSFTQCQPGNQLWLLSAKHLTLDSEEGQGRAKQAKISINGLPVFYFPYVQFPIGNARQSGLLFPNISNSNSGFDLAIPYYFNIAPQLDATFSPRYHAKRGYITQASARWLNRFDSWNIDLAYLDQDPVYAQQQASNGNPQVDANRWLLNIQEQGQWGKHIFSEIDVIRSSDRDYLRDLNNFSLSSSRRSHLHQRAEFNYYGDQFSAGVKLQHYQSLLDDQQTNATLLEKIPEWYLAFQSPTGPFSLGASGRWQESHFEQQQYADIHRRFGELNIELPMQWSGIRLRPSIGVQHLNYRVDFNDPIGTNSEPEEFTSTAPQAALQLDLLLENNDGRKLLVPGLLYQYRDADKNYPHTTAFNGGLDSELINFTIDQLLASSPYSGYDYLAETEQVSLYVNHRRFDSVGHETLAVTVGQIFYLDNDDDQMIGPQNSMWPGENQNNSSAIVGELTTSLSPAWQSSLSMNWNPHQEQLAEGHWQLAYRGQEKASNILNMGYHYRRANQQSSSLGQTVSEQTIEQADLSFVKALSPQWSVIGRYQYDAIQKRSNEALAGLTYSSCCIRWQVVYRDALVYRHDNQQQRRDRSVFLQVELKGLFGIGSKVDNILSESINGYRSNDRQNIFYD